MTIMIPQLTSPLKTELEKHANLLNFIERMNAAFYPSSKAA